MRAYTIVVQPDAQDEGHTATVPDLPGWAASGRTVEASLTIEPFVTAPTTR